MIKRLPGWYWTILLSLFSLGVGLMAPTWFFNGADERPTEPEQIIAQAVTATETLLPATPLSTPTQRNALRPPPTIEPPTATPPPTDEPTTTPTQPVVVNVTVEGIRGLPTATPQGEEGCEIRSDWQLTYEVQLNETLSMIANRFNINVFSLAEGNCLDDANVITVGQRLQVPGETMPVAPEFVCEGYMPLQPINNAADIPATGDLVFNWRGPRTPRQLLRIYPPDYDFDEEPDSDEWFDYTMDLRQNETVDLLDLQAGGTWFWQVYPLDEDFVQVCPESPVWVFNKTPLNEDE